MTNLTPTDGNSGHSYLQQFDKAQENFALICKEYKDSPMCKRSKRRMKSKP